MKRLAFVSLALLCSCGKSSAVAPTATTVNVSPATSVTPTVQEPVSIVEQEPLAVDFAVHGAAHDGWIGAHANAPVTPTGIWASGDLVIAAGAGKILRSTDRGQHWSAVDGPGDQPVVWGSSIGDIYVAGRGVVRSTDGGRTWTSVTTPPGTVYGIWGTPKGDLVWTVGASSDAPAFIAKSKDHGATWTTVRHQEKPSWLYDVIGAPDGKTTYFVGKKPAKNDATEAFLMRTLDEYAMEQPGRPKYPSGDYDGIRKICFSGSGAIFATTSYGVHVSRDQARTWKLAADVGTEVLSLGCSGKRIVAGARNHQLRISDDDGITWRENETDAAIGQPLVAITAVFVFPNGDTIVGAESYDQKKAHGTLLRYVR